jgi:hypothetical protein
MAVITHHFLISAFWCYDILSLGNIWTTGNKQFARAQKKKIKLPGKI